MNEIVMIPVEKLEPHPNNPRKDLGNLTELIGSIRQKGVLQNLTVVPNGEKYRIIIGHRRHQAALEAGLTELPVVVAEMTEKEQQQIMLTENLQREDLTTIEQADGFQLLMELGATVEEIAKDTGFAESTIYHRLNIAKLSKKSIREAEKEAGGQLKMADYILLEQIEDVKTRNKILEKYGGTSNFKYQVEREAKDEKERNLVKKLEEEAKKKGMKKGEYFYSWNASPKVKDYEEGGKIKKNLPNTEYYAINSYGTAIIFYSHKTKEEMAEEKKSNKKVDKAEEIRKGALEEIRKQEEEMKKDLLAFAKAQLEEASSEYKEVLLLDLLAIAIGMETIREQFTKEEVEAGLSLEQIVMAQLTDDISLERYTNYYDGSPSSYLHYTLTDLENYFKPMGFTWKENQQKLIEGTHSLQEAIKNRHNQK